MAGTQLARLCSLMLAGLKSTTLGHAAALAWSRVDRLSHAFLSSSRQQRPTWKLTWSRSVRRTLEQASVGASSHMLLDTARSPWAPAQAPQVARVATLGPSSTAVAMESQG